MIRPTDITFDGYSIVWKIGSNQIATIELGEPNVFEIRKGPNYVSPQAIGRSYINNWPAHMVPPRWRYVYTTLLRYYEQHYEVHPNAHCQEFCPICWDRKQEKLGISPLLIDIIEYTDARYVQ